jgi:hypothetical protein
MAQYFTLAGDPTYGSRLRAGKKLFKYITPSQQ